MKKGYVLMMWERPIACPYTANCLPMWDIASYLHKCYNCDTSSLVFYIYEKRYERHRITKNLSGAWYG